jgi:hypothetical protein
MTMTDGHRARPRRPRHAALGGRIIAAGLSASGAIVLIASMAEAGRSAADETPAPVAQPAGAAQRASAATAPTVTAAPRRARANATSRAS